MQLPANSLKVLATLLAETQAGRHPTYRELVKLCGWSSPNSLSEPLQQLQDAGLVSREKWKNSTLRPTCRMFLFEEALR